MGQNSLYSLTVSMQNALLILKENKEILLLGSKIISDFLLSSKIVHITITFIIKLCYFL